jgi:hypothetical protein
VSNQTVSRDFPTDVGPPTASLGPNGHAWPQTAIHRTTAVTRGESNAERRKHSIDVDKVSPPSGGRSAEVILIPKPLRAEWMDVMAADPELTPAAYKTAGAIGSHFNRHSGNTFVSQETLADFLQVSLRTVQTAIAELEARGYLIVKRRDLGLRRDGRRAFGGRGVANVYLPAFERSQVAATERGRRLAERIDQAWQTALDRAAQRTQRAASFGRGKDAADCVLSENKARSELRPLGGERTQNPAGKDAADCVPTLKEPSVLNPTRGRAGARGVALAHPLGAAAENLRKELRGGFDIWFGKVTVIGLEDGVLTCGAPNAFTRDYLQRRYELETLRAWNNAHGRSQLAQRVDFELIDEVGK